jgi:toxoflavin synthase
MVTDYDVIAARYRQAKQQPWRSAIESFTLMELVGPLSGEAVVDLACGEGFYTRQVRRQGAGRVVGVDLSHEMIALARAEEEAHPSDIAYLVQDAKSLRVAPEFDVAVAAYLLNYARSREELDAMCRGVAGCLKPGGRFVTVNSNPALDVPNAPSYRDYGFTTTVDGPLVEGAPITWTFFLDDGPLSLENYHLDVAAHEEALRAAGFAQVRWHQPRVSPRGQSLHDRGYWDAFLTHPPVIFLECVKSPLP